MNRFCLLCVCWLLVACRSLGSGMGTGVRFVTRADDTTTAGCNARGYHSLHHWIGRVIENTENMYATSRAPEGPTFLWLLGAQSSTQQRGTPGPTIPPGTKFDVVGLWYLTNEPGDHCFVTAVLSPHEVPSKPALFGVILAEFSPDGEAASDPVVQLLRPVMNAPSQWTAARFERIAESLAKENAGWQLNEWMSAPETNAP